MAGFFSSGSSLTLVPPRRTVGLIPKCGQCGLHKHCKSDRMPVWGEGRRRVLVAGQSPGATEDRQNRPFVGKAGRQLRKTLNRINVDLDRDCWTTNALRCWPHTDKGSNRTPTAKEIKCCQPYLVNSILELKPDVIIPLGAEAVQSLIDWLWNGDMGAVGRWIGNRVPVQSINSWICPAWHPRFVMRQEGKRDHAMIEMMHQQHLEAAFALEGRPWNPVPDYRKRVRVIIDPSEASREVLKLLAGIAPDCPVAWDIETNMLAPDSTDAAIWSCSLCAGGESISFPWHGEVVGTMLDFLRSPVPKIGWNARFETRWLKARYGLTVMNWVFDGMLAAHVLDNRAKTKGLDFQAFARLGFNTWDQRVSPYLRSKGGSSTANRIHECPLPDLLFYGGIDSLLEWELGTKLAKELKVNLC